MSELFQEGATTPENATNPEPAQAEAAPVAQPAESMFASHLEAIQTTEGKPKYSSVPQALDGLKNAQEHIARLEAENAQMRAKTTEAATVEQLMAKLDEPREVPTAQPGVSIEDVTAVARQAFMESRQNEADVANIRSVEAEMAKRFGAEANTRVVQTAADLGMSSDELKALAIRSPKAFLANFPAPVAPGTPTPANMQALNTEALRTGRRSDAVKLPDNVMYGAKSHEITDLWKTIAADVSNQYK